MTENVFINVTASKYKFYELSGIFTCSQ